MIAILDFDMGNVGSIQNMLSRIGIDAVITNSVEEIICADKIILPGDGAFDTGMRNLKATGLMECLTHEVFVKNKPILGICIGMQILANSSEEGIEPGLGWIKGTVKKMNSRELNLKVPHMGWNGIKEAVAHPIFDNLTDEERRFYFVHSYYMECEHRENVLATTTYGNEFTSMVYDKNIIGVQFHPEKSHRYGMQLLKNFSKLS
jgi:glutamine amidotransferase